jgi:hypothetical protein
MARGIPRGRAGQDLIFRVLSETGAQETPRAVSGRARTADFAK